MPAMAGASFAAQRRRACRSAKNRVRSRKPVRPCSPCHPRPNSPAETRQGISSPTQFGSARRPSGSVGSEKVSASWPSCPRSKRGPPAARRCCRDRIGATSPRRPGRSAAAFSAPRRSFQPVDRPAAPQPDRLHHDRNRELALGHVARGVRGHACDIGRPDRERRSGDGSALYRRLRSRSVGRRRLIGGDGAGWTDGVEREGLRQRQRRRCGIGDRHRERPRRDIGDPVARGA